MTILMNLRPPGLVFREYTVLTPEWLRANTHIVALAWSTIAPRFLRISTQIVLPLDQVLLVIIARGDHFSRNMPQVLSQTSNARLLRQAQPNTLPLPPLSLANCRPVLHRLLLQSPGFLTRRWKTRLKKKKTVHLALTSRTTNTPIQTMAHLLPSVATASHTYLSNVLARRLLAPVSSGFPALDAPPARPRTHLQTPLPPPLPPISIVCLQLRMDPRRNACFRHHAAPVPLRSPSPH